jgi:hypothetical protein
MRAPVILALCLLGCGGGGGSGCGGDVDAELMAGQVARVNRDLALLTERVHALEKQRGPQPPPAVTPPAPGSAPAAPSASLPGALEVRIDGSVHIDGKELAGPALAARLADHAGKGPGARVAVHIAASTPPARLAEVLELARQSGIREISVITEIP